MTREESVREGFIMQRIYIYIHTKEEKEEKRKNSKWKKERCWKSVYEKEEEEKE